MIGKLCHTLLSGAKDAYEWSFVAIPAQPKAGVTKAYSTWEGGNPSMKDWHSILKNTGNGITLTQEQAGDLLSHTMRWKRSRRKASSTATHFRRR